MKKSNIDAVIFDMDGVITNSTSLHSQAWKEMFDEKFMTAEEAAKMINSGDVVWVGKCK